MAGATLPPVLTRLRASLRRPWPLRLRVTFAVTGATAIVLAAAGVLVYVQFARTLDARTDSELRERTDRLEDVLHEERRRAAVLEAQAELVSPARRVAA